MNERPPTWLLALVVPAIALIAVVVTRAVEGPSSVAAPKVGANAVVIKNFTFDPAKLTVAAGSALKVTNADGTVHTLTARDDSFGTGDLGGGKTATVSLTKAGTFPYYCKIHNYMTGTLVVK